MTSVDSPMNDAVGRSNAKSAQPGLVGPAEGLCGGESQASRKAPKRSSVSDRRFGPRSETTAGLAFVGSNRDAMESPLLPETLDRHASSCVMAEDSPEGEAYQLDLGPIRPSVPVSGS